MKPAAWPRCQLPSAKLLFRSINESPLTNLSHKQPATMPAMFSTL
jgi:hypothetical protein